MMINFNLRSQKIKMDTSLAHGTNFTYAVKRFIAGVKANIQKERATELAEEYNRNLGKIQEISLAVRQKRNSDASQCRFGLPSVKPSKMKTAPDYVIDMSVPGSYSGREDYCYDSTPMKAVCALPAYRAWTKVKRNVAVDDDPVLRQIPYFGDDAKELCLDAYDVISSSSVVDLADREMPRIISECMREYSHIPADVVVETMSKILGIPNNVIEQIHKMKLQQGSIQVTTMDTSLAIPTCDDADLEAHMNNNNNNNNSSNNNNNNNNNNNSNGSEDECQQEHRHTDKDAEGNEETLRALFCRRCFMYDCKEHGGYHPLPLCQLDSNAAKDIVRCCDRQCVNSPVVEEDEDAINDAWSEKEKHALGRLVNIFGLDSCAIAIILATKTCREVYAELLSNPPAVIPRVTLSKKQKRKDRKINVEVLKKRRHVATDNKRFEYVPCSHKGPCTEENNCACLENGNFCEKYCGCEDGCRNRFLGCRCSATANRCFFNSCPCKAAARECDPDLCECGLPTLVAKPNPAEFVGAEHALCRNASMQLQVHKQLAIAPSNVAGWGLFTKEQLRRQEFLQEYTGELISQEEADRRGGVYDRIDHSFLFNLNETWVVDATRNGSKARFANHSESPNCTARVVLVQGDHRIGIFALRDIAPGRELFFDYRHDIQTTLPNWQQQYIERVSEGRRNTSDKAGASSSSNHNNNNNNNNSTPNSASSNSDDINKL